MLPDLKERKLVLASKSPRRADLLRQIGLSFTVVESDFDENSEVYTIPEVHVLQFAHKKALQVAETIKEGIIIGADTVVVLEGLILGKPEDKQDAVRMLRRLSGKTHTVYTGFAILENTTGLEMSDYEKTRVHFRELADAEIQAYVATQGPMDKAGAYGIQDYSAIFVDRIEGCFYNVVGFPVTKFYVTLQKFLHQLNHT